MSAVVAAPAREAVMEEAERVQGLIVALGAADDDIETITRNGEAEWSVAFDGDTIVTLHLVADEARLVLTVPLGRPPEEQRLAAYETLLCYNMLWPETGGVRMGLGGPHGELVQIADLWTGDLSTEVLGTVLRNMAEKARMWRRVIAGGTFADPSVGVGELSRDFLIRA
jgi:hypothetical protein